MRRGSPVALLAAAAAAGAFAAAGLAVSGHSDAGWTCAADHVTNRVTVFDNSNGGTVENGATAPTFSTGGKAYCVVLLQTYHWNGGHGSPPGTLGLKRVGGAAAGVPGSLGPYKALASSGQNNAPNVNWYAYVQPPGAPPQVIDGSYTCEDSGAATWSTTKKGGPGFCMVYGVPATREAAGDTTTTTATTTAPRYDLAVSISVTSQIDGDAATPQRITATVTVRNDGKVSSPAVPRTIEDGLHLGPAVVTQEFVNDLGEAAMWTYQVLHVSKLPPNCAVERDICPVPELGPGQQHSFTFTVLWTIANKRKFVDWSEYHSSPDSFYIGFHTRVNSEACPDEETDCRNNHLQIDVGVVKSTH